MSVLFFTSLCFSGAQPAKYSGKGIEYAVEGKFEEAQNELIKSLKADPFNKNTEFSLKVIDHALRNLITRETALLLFKGDQLYQNGTFDEAIDLFSKAIRNEPDYFISYLKRGNAYTGSGQYDLAVADAGKAITLSPYSVISYINRGIAYAKKEELDMAISDYNKAIEIDSLDADAYYNRGVANAKKGLAVNAILDFDRTIEINPRFARAYTNRGFVYMTALLNDVKACADWKQACELGLCGNYSVAKQKGYCK